MLVAMGSPSSGREVLQKDSALWCWSMVRICWTGSLFVYTLWTLFCMNDLKALGHIWEQCQVLAGERNLWHLPLHPQDVSTRSSPTGPGVARFAVPGLSCAKDGHNSSLHAVPCVHGTWGRVAAPSHRGYRKQDRAALGVDAAVLHIWMGTWFASSSELMYLGQWFVPTPAAFVLHGNGLFGPWVFPPLARGTSFPTHVGDPSAAGSWCMGMSCSHQEKRKDEDEQTPKLSR